MKIEGRIEYGCKGNNCNLNLSKECKTQTLLFFDL